MKVYRNQGAIGAYLDEYEKAISELKIILSDVSNKELLSIADPHTADEDCRSIQSILSHVVKAGYGYATAIRNHQGESLEYRSRIVLDSIGAYVASLDQMFAFNVKVFADYPGMTLEEYEMDKKMLVSWGQRYDVDQLMEHAICHILRHRRQIERFLIKLRAS